MPFPVILAWAAAVLVGGGAATAVTKKRAKSRADLLEQRVERVRARRAKLEQEIRSTLESSRVRQRARCQPALLDLQRKLERFAAGGLEELTPDPAVAETLRTVPALGWEVPKVGDHEPAGFSDPADFALSPLGGPVWLVLNTAGLAVGYVWSAVEDWKKVLDSEAEIEKLELETGLLERELPQLALVPVRKYEATVGHSLALAQEWSDRFDSAGLDGRTLDTLDAEGRKIVATLSLVRRFIHDAVEVGMKEW